MKRSCAEYSLYYNPPKPDKEGIRKFDTAYRYIIKTDIQVESLVCDLKINNESEKKVTGELLPGLADDFHMERNDIHVSKDLGADYSGSIPGAFGKILMALCRNPEKYSIRWIRIGEDVYENIKNVQVISISKGEKRLVFDAMYRERQVHLGLPLDISNMYKYILFLTCQSFYVLSDPAAGRFLSFYRSEILWGYGGGRAKADLFYGTVNDENGSRIRGIFYYHNDRLTEKYAVRQDRDGRLTFLFSDVLYGLHRTQSAEPLQYRITEGDEILSLPGPRVNFRSDQVFSISDPVKKEFSRIMQSLNFGSKECSAFVQLFEKEVIEPIVYPRRGAVGSFSSLHYERKGELHFLIECCGKEDEKIICLAKKHSFQDPALRLSDYAPRRVSYPVMLILKRKTDVNVRIVMNKDPSDWKIYVGQNDKKIKYSYPELVEKGVHLFPKMMTEPIFFEWAQLADYLWSHSAEFFCFAAELEKVYVQSGSL